MRKEVPLALQDAHMKHVKDSIAAGVDVQAQNFMLERTQIAGTEKPKTLKSEPES